MIYPIFVRMYAIIAYIVELGLIFRDTSKFIIMIKKIIIFLGLFIVIQANSQLNIDLEKLPKDSFPDLYYFADLDIKFIGKYKFDSSSGYELKFEKLFEIDTNRNKYKIEKEKNHFIIHSKVDELSTNIQEVKVLLKLKNSDVIIKTYTAKVSKILYLKINSDLYDDNFEIKPDIDSSRGYHFRLQFVMPKNYYVNIRKPIISFDVQQLLIDNLGNEQNIGTFNGWYDTGYFTNNLIC